jgi:hypothetical protein
MQWKQDLFRLAKGQHKITTHEIPRTHTHRYGTCGGCGGRGASTHPCRLTLTQRAARAKTDGWAAFGRSRPAPRQPAAALPLLHHPVVRWVCRVVSCPRAVADGRISSDPGWQSGTKHARGQERGPHARVPRGPQVSAGRCVDPAPFGCTQISPRVP